MIANKNKKVTNSQKKKKKKKQSPNFLKNKNHDQKIKSYLVKKKKKTNWTNCICASAHGHFCPSSSPIFSL